MIVLSVIVIDTLSRIDDPMQIKLRRRDIRLTQHHMHLSAVMRLMIEQVRACHVCRLDHLAYLIIDVVERARPERASILAKNRSSRASSSTRAARRAANSSYRI